MKTSNAVATAVCAATLLIFGGGATAAHLVDGADIQKNTITSKQIKNGTIKLDDVNAAARAQLQGRDGANGSNGASAFQPPPSGTVVRGGGLVNGYSPAVGNVVRDYSPLPFVPTIPLTNTGTPNIFYVPVGGSPTGSCAGSAASPTATPGVLCVYGIEQSLVASVTVYPGAAEGADADPSGFQVKVVSDSSGEVYVSYVWVYLAP